LSDEAGAKENWGSFWSDSCKKVDPPNEAIQDESLQRSLYEQSCKDAGVSTELA